MTAEGHKFTSLYGAKDPQSAMQCFTTSATGVLITTTVIIRRIDVLQVNMVVDYDFPLMYERNSSEGGMGGHFDRPDIETCAHGIGRTGRFEERCSISINFGDD
ncbi:hypothetical protein B0H13DRAFT_2337927 [Mycena leptocephala]|nr:hypothetical protein B0H13DRAFT_2337927 [Mycena leptocephala]